jgi:hypothetical protein
MGDRHNPKSIRPFEINDSKGKSSGFPAPGSTPAGDAAFGIELNFCDGGFDDREKSLAESGISAFVEYSRMISSLAASR